VTLLAGIGRAHWTIAAALAAAIVAVAPVRADGDPASDVLLDRNVFVPYETPSPSAAGDLERAVTAVYLHGDRIKVALIYGKDDLGAVPSLFGQPSQYAQFLGIELGLWYVGPLLVVMPGGFGLYDGGRTVAAGQQVLHSLPVAAGSPDDLVDSATSAVEHLGAAGVLRSPDVRAPFVTAYPAKATRGETVALHFDLFDDSGRSSALVRIYEGGSLLATRSSPMAFQTGTRHVVVRWPVPKTLESRQLRYCVIASDPSGNRSKPTCAPFLRVS
jgi:hypothetical protein